jgi:ribosomal protein S18 acetylase RimI-like enzyme
MTTLLGAHLRPLAPADLFRIVELTRATGVFRDEEIVIAEEVARDAITAGGGHSAVTPASGERPYYAMGAEQEGRLAGWICWGQTPCTLGTWDLYWLAVDPVTQGQGIGSALVKAMERSLAGRARLIAVNTSGRSDYAPTRRFYEVQGYRQAAVVPDYYAPGDDQVIYVKTFP